MSVKVVMYGVDVDNFGVIHQYCRSHGCVFSIFRGSTVEVYFEELPYYIPSFAAEVCKEFAIINPREKWDDMDKDISVWCSKMRRLYGC